MGGIVLSAGATMDVASLGAATRTRNNHVVLVLGTTTAITDPSLSIDYMHGSKLDLEDNDFIAHAGSSDTTGADFASIQALAAIGRNAPAGPFAATSSNGDGITSSVAEAVNSSAETGCEATDLAVVKDSDLILSTPTSWQVGTSSEPLGGNDVIIKYTYNGDAAWKGMLVTTP